MDPQVGVKVYPDGREVCADNSAGRREYRRRTQLMHERQAALCAICGKFLRLEEATFDHSRPRGLGGGFRDDRIEVDGVPINAAVHGLCNLVKGSRHISYIVKPHVVSDRHLEELLGE